MMRVCILHICSLTLYAQALVHAIYVYPSAEKARWLLLYLAGYLLIKVQRLSKKNLHGLKGHYKEYNAKNPRIQFQKAGERITWNKRTPPSTLCRCDLSTLINSTVLPGNRYP